MRSNRIFFNFACAASKHFKRHRTHFSGFARIGQAQKYSRAGGKMSFFLARWKRLLRRLSATGRELCKHSVTTFSKTVKFCASGVTLTLYGLPSSHGLRFASATIT